MKNPKRIISDGWLAIIVVASASIIDQLIKVWVKTNMTLHESIRIFDWFYISFIENNGMAYGMQIGSKLVLSLFRVVAISVLVYYLWLQVRTKARIGYIICLSMVLAVAIGNLIDCMFYGLIFSESMFGPDGLAAMVPFGQGYAPFLYGKVVDMFYFPLWTWPEWVPFVGGDIFFRPVFNFADSCITCGVIALLLFYTKVVNMGFHYVDPENSVAKEDSDEKD